ncbi:hypothetical protein Bca4012_052586 [Brassica carinata]
MFLLLEKILKVVDDYDWHHKTKKLEDLGNILTSLDPEDSVVVIKDSKIEEKLTSVKHSTEVKTFDEQTAVVKQKGRRWRPSYKKLWQALRC